MKTDYDYATGGIKTQATLENEIDQDLLQEERGRARGRKNLRFLKGGFKWGFILLLIGLVLFLLRSKIFYTVGSGEVIVVYYRFLGGTSHNQIGREGLHILAPWDEGFIYKTRTQSLTVPMTVLSANGIEVHLDAQLRFHPIPETVPYLHRQYGPNYITDIIVPQTIESVQDVIGQFLPEELYATQHGASTNRIFQKAKRRVGGIFIQVDDIALFNLKLPAKVQEAVQSKAEAEQIALAYEFRVKQEEREVERKLLEAKSLQKYQEIVKGIPQSVLIWKGIEATLELSKSPNSKIIVFGSKDNLPLMLGNVPDLGAK